MADSKLNKSDKRSNLAKQNKASPQRLEKSESSGKSVSPLLSPLALMALGLTGAAVAEVANKAESVDLNQSEGKSADLMPAETTGVQIELFTETLAEAGPSNIEQALQDLVQSMTSAQQATPAASSSEEAVSEESAGAALPTELSNDVLMAAASSASSIQNYSDSTGKETLSNGSADVILAQANTSPTGAPSAAASTSTTAAAGAEASAAAATGGLSQLALVGILAGVAVAAGGSSSSGPAGDTTAPIITSMGAKIGTSVITLTYNEALDASKVPQTSAFSITTGGQANAVTSVTISGNVVTLNLTSQIAAGNVSVAYTDPTSSNDVNAIQDTAGNDAVTFLQGKLADGYIRGAQIYIDTNKNGTADTSEALAGVVTDADGNFFLPSTAPKGTIIAVGGVNIDTGVPNTIPLKAPEGSTTINPLTTLVQAVVDNSAKPGATLLTPAQAATQVANALGLDLPAGASLTSYDPLSATDSGALEAQKASAQIATLVTLAANSNATTANAVQSNLATLVKESTTIGALDLTDSSTVLEAVTVTGVSVSQDQLNAINTANNAIAQAETLNDIAVSQADALDKVAPATPTLTVAALGNDATPAVKVTLNTKAIDGSAVVAGDTVVVYEGTTALSAATTITADDIAAGFVTINTSALAEGSHTLSARVTDKADNTSTVGTAAGTTATAVIDLTAPTASNVTSSSEDTGASASDRLTKDNTPTLSITAEAGSTVKVYNGETLLGNATEGAQGVFSYTTAALADGVHVLSAKATDPAGNTGAAGTTYSVTIDTAAPTASTLSPADGGQSLGLAANLILTASQDIAKGTGNITLYKADGTVAESFAVSSDKVTINGSAISINPSADLTKDQAYYVKVDAGAFTDLAGNAFAGISDATTWNFTAAGATIATSDIATNNVINAAELAAGVQVSGTVTAEFKTGTLTAQLQPSTGDAINLENVVYNQETGAWTADVPKSLSGTTSYTLNTTFTGSGSAAGITGTGQKSVQLDTVAPTAAAASLATNSGSTADTITNVGTVNITGLESNATWQYSTDKGANWLTGSGSSVTLTGDGDKSIIVKQTDTAGNESSTSTAFDFTLDTVAPTASTLSPADGGQSLGLAANLILTASQDIAKGTGNITLYKADGTVAESFAVSSDKVTINGSAISINPSADLTKDQAYYVKVDAGAFTDLAGNAFAGISDATTWNFTAAGATIATSDIATNNVINAEELKAGVQVSGTVTAEFKTGTLTAQLQPSTGDAINLENVVYNQETGAWTADVPKSLSGTTSYTLNTTFTGSGSAAGITGTGQKSVQLDTVAPTAAAASLATNSGSTADTITNVGTVNITGLESNATWQYSTDKGANWLTGSGSSVTLTGDGDKSIIVKQTDTAGNESNTSTAFDFTLDTTAPAKGTITQITENSGFSGTDRLTNDTTPVLTFTATAGQKLILGSGNQALADSVYSVTDDNGTYTITVKTALTDGGYGIVVLDAAGNYAELITDGSDGATFLIDQTAPTAPTITTLATDSGVLGDLITNDKTPTLTVTTEPGIGLKLMQNTTEVTNATIEESKTTPGSYTVTVEGDLNDGNYNLVAIDGAGNKSTSTASAFKVDTSAPSQPVITALSIDAGTVGDRLTNTTPVLSVTAEAGAKLFVGQASTVAGSGPVEITTPYTVEETSAGVYSVTFSSALADGSYGLMAIDAAGNRSLSPASLQSTATFAIDKVAPSLNISLLETTQVPTFEFAFSEAVKGFDASDVIVENGTKGAFTVIDNKTYRVEVELDASTSPVLFKVNANAGAGQDFFGNASTAPSAAFSKLTLIGTTGADVLTNDNAAATYIDLSEGGNDTIKLTSASHATVAALDEVNGFASGDKIDLSAILKTAGYSGSLLGDSGTGFIELNNLSLVKNTADGYTTVGFNVKLDAASIGGSKIDGINLDLAYDTTKVIGSSITSPTYTSGITKNIPIWSPLDGNYLDTSQGPSPTGKIAMPANTKGTNPIIETSTGTTLLIELYVDGLVDTFSVGIQSKASGGTTDVHTVDGTTHNVEVGVSKTAGLTAGGAGILEIFADTNNLVAPTDNQLHMLVKYVSETDTTQLRVQYDTNSATGTTAVSEVIALDFSGDVTTNLTPAALTFI